MKFLVLTLALLACAFSVPTWKGQGKSSKSCTIGNINFESGKRFNLPDTNKCLVYYCNDGVYDLVSGGCEDEAGVCHEVGSIWGNGGCVSYTCEIQEESKRAMYRVKRIYFGCEYDGVCRELNSSWTEGCSTFKCHWENDEFLVRPDPGGCEMPDGNCYSVNETWVNKCVKYICRAHDDYKITEVLCQDADSVCRYSDERFPVTIIGIRYSDCGCTINYPKSTRVEYFCNFKHN